MALMRSMLLAASQNVWMREHAVKVPFVRRSVSRFMPGESLDAALTAAQGLLEKKIGTVVTHLGENVADRNEAGKVTEHYLEVLEHIHQANLPTEVSVKLTQLGLDLSPDFCFENLERIIERENNNSTVWVDMEASNYVDATLDIYRRALKNHANVGLCLQAYLYRTKKDLADLLPMKPSIRLVKGAYKEPAEIAFPRKADVDESYFALQQGLAKNEFEVQMLYGIQRAEQERLAEAGSRSLVLVAYGTYWYPWFVRRLAERPANVWFLLRNVFAS